MLARSPGIIRLMTWNIHGGVGPDRCFDLDRIAALITRHRPDIVALQEIDTRGRGLDCLAPLHRLHSAHFAEVRTVAAPDGHYGHAVFSRWPTADIQLHDLSMQRREPRFAIETRIETPFGDVHLVAVHLGLDIIERRRQARMLAALAIKAAPLPTVMLGDFNDWFSFGHVRKTLARVLPVRTSVRTFPAWRPMLRLDRVYCSDAAMLIDSFTDKDARRCSDHLPVIADIRLPEPLTPGDVGLTIENREPEERAMTPSSQTIPEPHEVPGVPPNPDPAPIHDPVQPPVRDPDVPGIRDPIPPGISDPAPAPPMPAPNIDPSRT